MSMYNDIAWQAKGNKERCEKQFTDSCELCSQIPSRSLVFLVGLDQKKSGTEHTPTNQMDPWDRMAEEMMANFFGSGHPIFRASSSFERGELRSKGGVQEVKTLQW